MPASAVIPAPIVYTNIAAVKKLVVTGVARLGRGRGIEGRLLCGKPARDRGSHAQCPDMCRVRESA